jgi:unsaturated rhamnogalacturonyl hydrolase
MLLRYSAYTGDTRYRDEGVSQLLGFTRVLTDEASHLATHAYDDVPGGAPVPPFEHHTFWARGNGWMLATLVDALEHLPHDYPTRKELLSHTTRLERALHTLQRPTGLFGTLLQDPDSYEETAGSALILYGMARGTRLGLFGDATRAAIERGGRGLWSVIRRRGPEAHVTGTSLGTNPIEALYARTPTLDQLNYGVGAWLLAAIEIADVFADRPLALRAPRLPLARASQTA